MDSVLRRVGERHQVTGEVRLVDGDLVAHPAQVFSRDELLQQIWGWSFGDQTTVTVHCVAALGHFAKLVPGLPVPFDASSRCGG